MAIDEFDDAVHNARRVPLTGQVRVPMEDLYAQLDELRALVRPSRR